MNSKIKKIAFAGNPNTGKSTLFNKLTNLKQKTSNVPGTTVELRVAQINLGGELYEIYDLPGTYSIFHRSEDEKVATQLITDKKTKPDLVLFVADAENLKRNLLYFAQLSSYKIPMVLIINREDLIHNHYSLDIERLQNELGIPVLLVSAFEKDIEQKLENCIQKNSFLLHYNFSQNKPLEFQKLVERHQKGKIDTEEISGIEEDTLFRQKKIDKLLNNVSFSIKENEKQGFNFDRYFLHPLWGYIFFFFVLYLVFQAVFTLAQWPMDLIDSGFMQISKVVGQLLPEHFISDLLTEGLIAGIAGVVIFIPQIALLFFFISILEETGYMSRIAFLMDKFLNLFGLSGKSSISLMSATACAIPAIMAARNIESKKQRLLTMMVTPFMSCSARLPVYTLLIGVMIPPSHNSWIFNSRGLALMALYLLGLFASLVGALIIQYFIKDKTPDFLVMEMPNYKKPKWRNVITNVYLKSRSFVIEAGKIIVLVSIALWFLASFAPHNEHEKIDQLATLHNLDLEETSRMKLETSYAGRIGKVIEPAIKPLGFNWQIGIAVFTSFAAREVFVGTLNTLYSIDGDEKLLQEKIQNAKRDNGKKLFSPAVLVSLLLFYAFALQCMSTLAVMYKETKSFKWPLIQFLVMTGIAYLVSFIAFQILS